MGGTATVDLSSLGRSVIFFGTMPWRLRGAATSGVTATAGDFPRSAARFYRYSTATRFVSIRAESAGTLYWARGSTR